MQLVTALIYWVVVALWLAVLAAVIFHFARNRRTFGTTRILLLVVAIDTIRNLVENVYFGLYWGSEYGLFSSILATTLGNPYLLVLPKIINIAAGGVVLVLLLMRWLPGAVQERKHSEQLATTDALTALSNRRHFDTLAHAEWARFQRYGRPLSLLTLDVDKFKSINDRFGHDAGDRVLRTVADICALNKRQTDTVARIGGEEFALLLPETGEAAAAIAAERLRKAIEDCPCMLPGEDLTVTISIGLVEATRSMAAFEVLLKRADEAMYEAKRTGRNRVVRSLPAQGEPLKVAAE